jgi:BAI1-associated protein 2
MAKHFSQFFYVGHTSIESNIEWWNEVAKTREMLPTTNINNGGDMATLKRPVELKAINASVGYDDYGSVKSFIRKSQSHHGSFIDVDANETSNSYPTLTRPPRAMSEHSLVSSQSHARMSNFNNNMNNDNAIVTAIFDFMSSAENQLTFQEGDKIQSIGEKIQGWQFGENLRSNQFGW